MSDLFLWCQKGPRERHSLGEAGRGGLTGTCFHCGLKIRRAHVRSAWWRTDEADLATAYAGGKVIDLMAALKDSLKGKAT